MAPTSRTPVKLAALLGSAALVLTLAACGNSSDDGSGGSSDGTSPSGSAVASDAPGVTDDEIRFAAIGTQENNPLGTCVLDCFVEGIQAYFAYRNSEGGVDGRQLVLSEVLDDQLAQNQERSLEVIAADDVFGVFASPQVASGFEALYEQGFPVYSWAINHAEMSGRDSIYGNTGVQCLTCTRRSGVYAGTVVDATKVATLGYGVSQNSKDCAAANAQAVEMYADDTGQEVVYTNDSLEFGLANGIAPEVTAMKDAGVDFIMACIDLNGMKTLAQELARQDMSDVRMVHSNTYDAEFVAEAGGLFDGDIMAVPYLPLEADIEGTGLETFVEWMDEEGYEFSEPALVGWVNADLAYQGLMAADGLSREAVITATNTFTDWTADGVVAPVDWSVQHEAPTEDDPTTHGAPQECFAYVTVVDGEFEIVGDAETPWFCWSNESRDWAEPSQESFA